MAPGDRRGISHMVSGEAATRPEISHGVTDNQAGGAINFPASHNPPEYNGIKFSTPDRAPALPEATKKIEAEIAAIDAGAAAPSGPKAAPQPLDAMPSYVSRLREAIDLASIRKAGVRVAFDTMWGAPRGYLVTIICGD